MIIDTHVHIGNIAGFNMPKENVLYSMKKYHIDYSIVSSGNAAEFDCELSPISERIQHSQIECLNEVLDISKEYPSKIGVAVWVKPFNENADNALYDIIEKNLKYIKAIKIHPFHSNIPFDSPKTEQFIEMAENFSLPVITHTGNSDNDSCIRVYNMAKKHPKTNFFMAHMGLGTDNSKAIELVSELPNLYGDTTWVSVKSTLRLIEKAGIKKVVFGSDNPIDGKDTYLVNKTGHRSLYQEYFNELKDILSKDYYNRLMYKNAQKLFKIDI